ncbi:MAG: class I SAM-dependent methyltransferase [Candidatus Eiseniibacteriota bacterium]
MSAPGSGPADDPALHELDPTGRFSDRAAEYVRYRPGYPPAAIDAMLAGLAPPSMLTAADIGAGTGISARALADRGVSIFAIEPNRAMREAAEPHVRVTWQEGTAEATGLPDASVDLLLAAQAFHWFRVSESLAEFHRVMRPASRLALMWNARDREDLMSRGYIEAIHEVNGEHPAEMRPFDPTWLDEAGRFTGLRSLTFAHSQELDRDGLIGRATSASYVPREGKPYARLAKLLAELFERHRDDRGLVRLRYVTELHLATRRP